MRHTRLARPTRPLRQARPTHPTRYATSPPRAKPVRMNTNSTEIKTAKQPSLSCRSNSSTTSTGAVDETVNENINSAERTQPVGCNSGDPLKVAPTSSSLSSAETCDGREPEQGICPQQRPVEGRASGHERVTGGPINTTEQNGTISFQSGTVVPSFQPTKAYKNLLSWDF